MLPVVARLRTLAISDVPGGFPALPLLDELHLGGDEKCIERGR